MVIKFTENGLVCAQQKHVLILQLIDTEKGVANPLCSCLSFSFNIPSLVSGKRLCFSSSSLCIESYLTRIWEGSQIEFFAYTMGNRDGGFIRVVIRVILPFIWISRLGKTLKERGVFLFSWFTSFHFSYKVVQRAVCVSSLVIFWREPSSEANSKKRYRRSR